MKTKYILQLGLAFVLLFAGSDILIHPADWISFVPHWVINFGVSLDFALKSHAYFEIILGLLLLTGYKLRIIAALAALDILSIILVNGFSHGILLITFRDIGLFTIGLFLALDRN